MHHESWWLKVKRAQKHMVDLRREARHYSDTHPYEIIPIGQPGSQQNVNRYTLRITQQPDPIVAIILGDFIHNLRSALDHIVVACTSPRSAKKNASFPIATENPWAKDAQRRYLIRDGERRKSFARALKGLDPAARAIVERFQPYRIPAGRPDNNAFAIISRLENADKHRELITVGAGIIQPLIYARVSNTILARPLIIGPYQFLEDGAELTLPKPMSEAFSEVNPEMNVEFGASTMIAIKVAERDGLNRQPFNFSLYPILVGSMISVRYLLRLLEPFVIR